MAVDRRVHVGSAAKAALAAGVLRLISTGHLALSSEVRALPPHSNRPLYGGLDLSVKGKGAYAELRRIQDQVLKYPYHQ
jgi:hypothetical protein